MTLATALVAAQLAIDAVPDRGLANGDPYVNTAMPGTSHVREHLKWPMASDAQPRTLVDHICRYSRVDLDTAARAALAANDKVDIETAVIIATARLAAYRFGGWTLATLNPSEVVTVPAAEAQLAVHANNEVAVAEALEKWAGVAPRYMAVHYYNSISYEVCSHNHLPAKTKKLASTTINLSGLKEFITGDAEREGCIFHDMFHPVGQVEKSNAARRVQAGQILSNLKFDNLRKRIPVKAPDSGVAINYSTLYRKAKSYHHTPEHIPDGLAPPANVIAAIRTYESAATATALTDAVSRLRELSVHLEEPSAYLAGFILGREAATVDDAELDLRTAARQTTILGSPAYARAAGEFSGTFAGGKENGFARVAADVATQVLPRCTDHIATAAAL